LDLRCGQLLDQGLDALGLLRRLLEASLSLREGRVRGTQLDFEAGRVNAIENVARLHLGTLFELTFNHDSRDSGANFGHLRRRDAAR
jgi:hypothetical protein